MQSNPGKIDHKAWRGLWLRKSFLVMVAAGLFPLLHAAPGEKRWEYPTGSAAHSSPALGTNGLLYVGGGASLHALDARTGTGRWSHLIGDGEVDASPALGADGTVYVVSQGGTFCALDGTTGSRKWQARIGGRAVSSPAVGPDGTVYIGSEDKCTYAFDGPMGTQKWKCLTEGAIWSSPAIGPDGTVFVGSYDRRVYALDPVSGLKLWAFNTGGRVIASPAVGPEGRLFIASEDGKVYALDCSTGAKVWEFDTGSSIWSSVAIAADASIYVGSDGGSLYALDGNTGTKLWEHQLDGAIWSSPALAADGMVYVGSGSGCLFALDGATGAQHWRFRTGGGVWSSPAIGPDGTVYLGPSMGKVVAVEGAGASGALAQSVWPRFRANQEATGVSALPTVQTPPSTVSIVSPSQRELLVLMEGTNAVLSAEATGWPLCYCWSLNGAAIPGATRACYAITNAGRADDGVYRLAVSNSLGQATSQPLTVVVSNVDPLQFTELDWESAAPSYFDLQWTATLTPNAVWHEYALAYYTSSGPVILPGQGATNAARFFRFAGAAAARFSRITTHSGCRFEGSVGSRYSVEYVSPTTGWTIWHPLATVTATNSMQWFVDRETRWCNSRVYRVTRLP
jgi:outer membrane protein assembly factor BamB